MAAIAVRSRIFVFRLLAGTIEGQHVTFRATY